MLNSSMVPQVKILRNFFKLVQGVQNSVIKYFCFFADFVVIGGLKMLVFFITTNSNWLFWKSLKNFVKSYCVLNIARLTIDRTVSLIRLKLGKSSIF